MTDILEFDRQHLWHPYTSMVDPLPCYEAVSAEGVMIRLRDGRELIDGMSSWWCAIHGYNHPELNRALVDQTRKMSHVMFGGITHAPAVELAQQLIDLTPPSLDRVFFADSGSVAMEVALKMVMQYWFANDRPEKHRLLTIAGGYHGDTFGAMSVCDPVTGMHEKFVNVLPKHLFAPRPSSRFGEELNDDDRNNLTKLVETHHNELAALVLEPIVQGAGGMWFYSSEYLRLARQLCNEFDLLLVFDEIATGFGRTGEMFAVDYVNIEPDVLCVGKALTGGTMTLAACLANERIATGISADGGALMHGPTFMANPLACSVAKKSIELLEVSDWRSCVSKINAQLQQDLRPLGNLSGVHDVRVIGAIGVVQMDAPVNVVQLQKRFVEEGVWIRPFNDLIYLMPPYITQPEELSMLVSAIESVVT
ncbi:MAG: adenosylmethionine--8-amino-7-oxononanoate transaminase [Gammaproteobacteria bacterium]|nr:adenosylmethionine--8-amino-7-oxononanoate transaminase [Gammaproteobacteria bacterium]